MGMVERRFGVGRTNQNQEHLGGDDEINNNTNDK